MEVKPCGGEKPLTDPLTGKELDCGSGPSRKDCPSGSYCHQTVRFSRCCHKGELHAVFVSDGLAPLCIHKSRWGGTHFKMLHAAEILLLCLIVSVNREFRKRIFNSLFYETNSEYITERCFTTLKSLNRIFFQTITTMSKPVWTVGTVVVPTAIYLPKDQTMLVVQLPVAAIDWDLTLIAV